MRSKQINNKIPTEASLPIYIKAFWKKVNKTETCWNWTASKFSNGYGQFQLGVDNIFKAHRFSFFLANGYINSEDIIMHTCDNKLCVNPLHLKAGTQIDNIKDRTNKGRSAKGSLNGASKLTEQDILSIKERIKQKETCVEIAKTYNVTSQAISRIKWNKSWKHVKPNLYAQHS